MIFESMPEGRCGFQLRPGDVNHDPNTPDELWHYVSDAICCWQESWRDTGRCIWHADLDEKPVNELVARYEDINSRLDGINLSGVVVRDELAFSGCVLYGSKITEADFSGTDFRDANLTHTDFEGTDLHKANFKGADLERANFEDANLKQTNFRSADLTDAKFQDAKFKQTNFEYSRLRGVDFANRRLARANFEGAKLFDADFQGADLEQANFRNAKLRTARLRSANLRGVDFKDADLKSANLMDTDVESGNFESAGLAFANLESASLHNTTFRGATLTSTVLRDTSLRRADFANARLFMTDFSGADCWRTDFTGTRLRDANFEEANLKGADFKGSDLEDASLVQTDLRKANLENAQLYQTLLSEARINSDTKFGNTCIYENPDELDDDWDQRWDVTPTEAAVWTYRRLQNLHEKYALTERARHYHVKKKEAQKRCHKEEGNYPQWIIHAINGLVSKHGESPWRVVEASGVVIAVWSVLYFLFGEILPPSDRTGIDPIGLGLFPSISLPAPLGEIATSIYFSTVTFTTLGHGDLQPATGFTQALTTVESFLGALLMAYLVFVLGRRTNW